VVSGQQAVAKGAHVLPSDRLRQKQLQVTTAPTSLQIGRHILTSQHPGQLAQALPGLGVISIEDDETGSAFLVKKISAYAGRGSGHLPLAWVTRNPNITELCGYTETLRHLRRTDCGGTWKQLLKATARAEIRKFFRMPRW